MEALAFQIWMPVESQNQTLSTLNSCICISRVFLRSIMSSSTGFILRDDVEITSVNRPEGRVFDWLYEPIWIMKEQIRSLKLSKAEELYFYKHCLYGGDVARIESWENDGIPSEYKIKKA